MTRNLLSEGCSKRFKSEDEWFPREISENSLEQRLSPYFNMEKIWKVFQI